MTTIEHDAFGSVATVTLAIRPRETGELTKANRTKPAAGVGGAVVGATVLGAGVVGPAVVGGAVVGGVDDRGAAVVESVVPDGEFLGVELGLVVVPGALVRGVRVLSCVAIALSTVAEHAMAVATSSSSAPLPTPKLGYRTNPPRLSAYAGPAPY